VQTLEFPRSFFRCRWTIEDRNEIRTFPERLLETPHMIQIELRAGTLGAREVHQHWPPRAPQRRQIRR